MDILKAIRIKEHTTQRITRKDIQRSTRALFAPVRKVNGKKLKRLKRAKSSYRISGPLIEVF